MKKTTAITISMNRTNSAVDGEQRMTSVEIAELTGKSHFNVMKAIRNMEPAWVNVGQFHFELTSYTDAQGKERPCYSLTKTAASSITVAMVVARRSRDWYGRRRAATSCCK